MPVRQEENPTIAGVPLPKRPTFATAQAHVRIDDPAEYERTRQRILQKTQRNGPAN